MWVLNGLIGAVCCTIGAIVGIKDCKSAFGIPKGARPEEGQFMYYADLDNEEVDYGNILDY